MIALGSDDLSDLLARLVERHATVATAESLTGGRLAARFTDVAGISAVYVGGVVSYATELKIQLLGVPAGLVDEHGVISSECALAMASGVQRLTGATFGLATTGVAGPDRQEGKRVGTVYVALAGPEEDDVRRLSLTGTRTQIQDGTCDAVVALLAERLAE